MAEPKLRGGQRPLSSAVLRAHGGRPAAAADAPAGGRPCCGPAKMLGRTRSSAAAAPWLPQVDGRTAALDHSPGPRRSCDDRLTTKLVLLPPPTPPPTHTHKYTTTPLPSPQPPSTRPPPPPCYRLGIAKMLGRTNQTCCCCARQAMAARPVQAVRAASQQRQTDGRTDVCCARAAPATAAAARRADSESPIAAHAHHRRERRRGVGRSFVLLSRPAPYSSRASSSAQAPGKLNQDQVPGLGYQGSS